MPHIVGGRFRTSRCAATVQSRDAFHALLSPSALGAVLQRGGAWSGGRPGGIACARFCPLLPRPYAIQATPIGIPYKKPIPAKGQGWVTRASSLHSQAGLGLISNTQCPVSVRQLHSRSFTCQVCPRPTRCKSRSIAASHIWQAGWRTRAMRP